jgi:hypothetical protein
LKLGTLINVAQVVVPRQVNGGWVVWGGGRGGNPRESLGKQFCEIGGGRLGAIEKIGRCAHATTTKENSRARGGRVAVDKGWAVAGWGRGSEPTNF